MTYARIDASRRRLLGAFIALLSFMGTVGAAGAEDWPKDRSIRLLVPVAAGGNIDVTGRLVAARLSQVLGQQVVVENRVGGGGIIATEAVARAEPDGYTLLWGSTNVLCIATHTMKPPYDSLKDLAPVSELGSSPQVLLVNSKVPAKTVAEFIAYAKAQSAPMAYGGGGGAASASNLIMSLFLQRAGLKMTNVFYRGTAPALSDLIAGHILTTFVPMSEAYAQRDNLNVRMLAVSSGKRSARLPNVPSLAETYPGFDAVSWTAMMAPAGTPKPIIDRLASEIVKAVHDPKFVTLLQNSGIDPRAEGPQKLHDRIAAEIPIWGEAVKIAGVKVRK
jgi:tripartite-type tricarboxylate transporter receptor subunit TctC